MTLARCGWIASGRSEQGAASGLDAAWRLSAVLRDNGIIAGDTALAISSGTDLASAAASADLIIESIPEDLGLKQRFFQELGQRARPMLCSPPTPRASASPPSRVIARIRSACWRRISGTRRT